VFTGAPRKSLGQHFLQQSSIISEIIRSIGLQSEDKVVEIGPGRGALTLPLLRILDKLIAIEVDRDLFEDWTKTATPHLILLHADALNVDYNQWGQNVRLVGNLPYNISSPFLIHLLSYLASIQDMHFMLQKEVVDRLAAEPGTKAYGRLSVMMQTFCEVESLFEVGPEAFYPPPKVQSAVVRLVPRKGIQIDRKKLEWLLSQAFAMRRKTLANNLKKFFSAAQIEACGLDPKMRPEEVSVEEFLRLTEQLNLLPK
jgi:16S rRNA (adenine1518-N6/adenine1519-N6)-dimethyltransferase